jgi:hypothetical protein
MATQETMGVGAQANPRAALNKRLESAAWGLFLIMLGGMAFVPSDRVPEGYWSVGVGLILLGLNATRYVYHIRMSGFTTVLGVIALITGIGQLAGLDLPGLAILLILLGANLVLKPWLEERHLFGKAEDV